MRTLHSFSCQGEIHLQSPNKREKEIWGRARGTMGRTNVKKVGYFVIIKEEN
jgi:hypothetical protein